MKVRQHKFTDVEHEMLKLAPTDVVRLLNETLGNMPSHVPYTDSEKYGYPIIKKLMPGYTAYGLGPERDEAWVAAQQEKENE